MTCDRSPQHFADARRQFVDRLVAVDKDFPGEVAAGSRGHNPQEMIDLLPENVGLASVFLRPLAVTRGFFVAALLFFVSQAGFAVGFSLPATLLLLGELPLPGSLFLAAQLLFLGPLGKLLGFGLAAAILLLGMAALFCHSLRLELLLALGGLLDVLEGLPRGRDRLVNRRGHLADLILATNIGKHVEPLVGQGRNRLAATVDGLYQGPRRLHGHDQGQEDARQRKDNRVERSLAAGMDHFRALRRLQLAGLFLERCRGRGHPLPAVALLVHQAHVAQKGSPVALHSGHHTGHLVDVRFLAEAGFEPGRFREQGPALAFVYRQILFVAAGNIILFLGPGFHQQRDEVVRRFRIGKVRGHQFVAKLFESCQIAFAGLSGLPHTGSQRPSCASTMVSASSRCDLKSVT